MRSGVELHIHPNMQSAMQGPPGATNIPPGASMTGLRADMIYIHGNTQDWQAPRLQQWLWESVFTRLVDDNPARVVWDA